VPNVTARVAERHPRFLQVRWEVAWQHGRTREEVNVALTITDVEVQRLAAQVACVTGESTTQAIKVALRERRARLAGGVDPAAHRAALLEFMEREIWAHMPAELRGQPRDQARDDAIVGYGPDGLNH
jgi:antitoxin VapB